jgi:hypothetical protein
MMFALEVVMMQCPQGNGTSVTVSDFINPNSMITPGAAGAFTMVITNTLCGQFAGLPGNWTALGVSFLFAALTFFYTAKLPVRVIYFLINGLIIFVMAHGSNTVGMQATQRAALEPTAVVGMHAESPPILLASLSDAGTTAPVAPAKRERTDTLQLAQGTTTDKKKFFRQWSW